MHKATGFGSLILAFIILAASMWFYYNGYFSTRDFGLMSRADFEARCRAAYGQMTTFSVSTGGGLMYCESAMRRTADSGRVCTSDAECGGRCLLSSASAGTDLAGTSSEGRCSENAVLMKAKELGL